MIPRSCAAQPRRFGDGEEQTEKCKRSFEHGRWEVAGSFSRRVGKLGRQGNAGKVSPVAGHGDQRTCPAADTSETTELACLRGKARISQ